MRTLLVLTMLAPALSADPPRKFAPKTPAGTIAFSSIGPRSWDIYLTDLQTLQTRRLTDHAALDYNATFSPDDKQLIFVSEREGNPRLFVIQRDGTGLKRLTSV